VSARVKNVKEYLKELGEAKRDKPAHIKEALQIYIDLWKKALERGIIQQTDDIDAALSKIDAQGGLYRAAEE